MAVLDFPSIVTINAMEPRIVTRSQSFTSDLSGVTQTASLPGDHWKFSITFSNKTGRQARTLMGFLASLRGKAGRFRLPIPLLNRRTSTALDGGILTSVSSENVVTISGCVAPILTADSTMYTADMDTISIDSTEGSMSLDMIGDYVGINGELKLIASDVVISSEGVASFTIAPTLRNSTLGTVIETVNPTCVVMLSDDNQAGWNVQPLPIYAMSIAVEEALDI